MGTIELNFGGVGSFEAIEEDYYDIRCVEAEVKPNKAKDGMNLAMTFEIINHPQHEGRKLFHTQSLKENSLWRAKEVLEALTGESWEEDNMELDPSDLPGLTCRVFVVQDLHYDSVRAARGEMVNTIDIWGAEESGKTHSDDADTPF